MNNIKLDIRNNQMFYYTFFIIIEFIKTSPFSLNRYLSSLILILSVICLLFHIINNKYSLKDLIIVLIIIILGGMFYISNRKEGVLLTCIALAGMKNVDIYNLIKTVFFIRILNWFLTIVLSLIGIIPINTFIHNRNGHIITRIDLGFGHPNTFHIYTLIIILLYIYLYFDKIKIYYSVFLLTLDIILYQITLSRTGLIIGIIMSIFLIIFKTSNKFLQNAISIFILPCCFFISIIPAIFLRKYYSFYILDSLLSWRYSFSNAYITNYGIKLLGNNLENILGMNNNGIIDCSYVSMLVNCGSLFTVLYLLFTMWIFYKALKQKRKNILILLCCFSLYGVTESFLPNAFTNIGVLFIGYYLFIRPANKSQELKRKKRKNL